MSPKEEPIKKGEIIPIEFGGKVIATKRSCSCGGDVVFEPHPSGKGRLARCIRCGAELAFGNTP